MMELDNCPCSGANLPRFVQPVILAVLSSGPLHGYLVVQRLAETSLFRKQPPDATGVYRMLRNMEQEGVLESDWELENSRSGPQAVHADGKRRALSRPMDAHADFASGFHRQFALVFAGCALRHEFGTMPYAGAFRFPISAGGVPVRRIAFSTRLLRLRDTSTFCRSRTHGHLFFH